MFAAAVGVVAAATKEETGNVIDHKQNRSSRILQSPITSGEEFTRHRVRMHTTTTYSYSGSKSGKASKSSSATKSGKSSVLLVYQPIYDVNLSPTNNPTAIPTAAPEEEAASTDLPTYRPSSVASSMDDKTLAPTAEELISVTRQNLQMSLYFGTFDSSLLLNTNEQQYFEQQTAMYMEEFYNNADGRNGGLLDVIKNEVEDVTVIVTMEDQEYKYTDELRNGMRALVKVNGSRTINDVGDRYLLPTSTEVSEPCEGTNPLILTFSVEISYRLSGTYPIESDDVIAFPFSSVPYRQNYIDDYLKEHGAAATGASNEERGEESNVGEEENEASSAVFTDVYCTSRVDTEMDNSELPTIAPSTSPTILDETSLAPSILSNAPSLLITLPPTFPNSTTIDTVMPTTLTPTTTASSSPTYIPSTASLSMPPSNRNSAGATIIPTPLATARLTTIAPSSVAPTPSQSVAFSVKPSPSISIPTAGTGTAAPTSNAVSQSVSDAPTEAFEDNVGPADSMSVVEESLGLTLSPRPSTLEEDTTTTLSAFPTISTVLNAPPAPASNPPTIPTSSNKPTFVSTPKQTPGVEAATSNVPSPSGSISPRAAPDQMQLPMTTPSPSVNEVFADLRVSSSATTERNCGVKNIGLVSKDRLDEVEIVFMYGVEYTSADIHDNIDDLETLILDSVAKSVLNCASVDNGADAVESRMIEEAAANANEGVIGVRYPEFGPITSICKSESFIC